MNDEEHQMTIRKWEFERDYRNWRSSRGRACPEPKWEDYATRYYDPNYMPYGNFDIGALESEYKHQQDMHSV